MTNEIPADVLDELRIADEFEAACCELVDICTQRLEGAKHDQAEAANRVDEANEAYERAYRALDVAQAKQRTLRKTSGVVLDATGYRPGTPAELDAIRGDYVAVLTLGGPNPGLAVAPVPTGVERGDRRLGLGEPDARQPCAKPTGCGHEYRQHTRRGDVSPHACTNIGCFCTGFVLGADSSGLQSWPSPTQPGHTITRGGLA